MTALIVDDERLARAEMRRMLQAHPEIEIIGDAKNGDQALLYIPRLRPQVVFLDVQMPLRGGFDVLELLDDVPAIIFTTAYDHYALKAFEVSAVDYLVKPISPGRLAAAVAKLPARLAARSAAAAASPAALAGDRQIFLRDHERCWFVRLREVALLESVGNYTRLHFGTEHPLVLRSLNQLEARLDPTLFLRISRQHIVNIEAIERLDPWLNGGLRAKVRGGFEVTISRRQAQQ